jgi:hypothetical protein
MVTAQNNGDIDATRLGGVGGAASSLPVDSDSASMQIAVQLALGQFLTNVRLGGPAEPSPELLHLLRNAPAVLGRGHPHRRAELSLLAGLIHEFAHDIDGADHCYAEAGAADPSILKHGVLADIREKSIRRRGRSAVVVAADVKRGTAGRTTRAARPRSRSSARRRPRA